MNTNRVAAITLCSIAASCISELSLDNSKCPCTDGWICCEGEQVCGRDASDCPPENEKSVPALVDADILLVVDNSGSMEAIEPALQYSLGEILRSHIDAGTHYRIGMVSTDAHGFEQDCDGNALTQPGNRGNCADSSVVLRRPHDGALGRLVSAHDPSVFDPFYFTDLDSVLRSKLVELYPTDVTTGPATQQVAVQGVPWVIDAADVRMRTCEACDCEICATGNECFDTCAGLLEERLVEVYLRSNLSGLGSDGLGWEEGLKSALLAVGIDAEQTDDTVALAPPDSHIISGGANTYQGDSWLRDDARLLVLFFSDENDCSMSETLWNLRHMFESQAGNPPGSICYQQDAQSQFLATERLATLLKTKKSGDVAVGFVGGVVEADGDSGCLWVPGDCAATYPPSQPASTCSCLTGDSTNEWCAFTQNSTPSIDVPRCDALVGNRYADFASRFDGFALGSICGALGFALDDLNELASERFPVSPRCEVTDPIDGGGPPPTTGSPLCTCQVTASDSDGDCIADDHEDRNGNGSVDSWADIDSNGCFDTGDLPGETDPSLWDSDGDGIGDGCEDRNRNGNFDSGELSAFVPDTDCDGLADGVEDANQNGIREVGETNPLLEDTDSDGISDGEEDANGDGLVDVWVDTDSDGCFGPADSPGETDPRSVDSDADGILDALEDRNIDGICGATETCAWVADTDCDGLVDGIEDTNRDGITGAAETDPLNPDTDLDGILDGAEDANANGFRDSGETDPRLSDTDGDGIGDGTEDRNHNGVVDSFDTNANGCWDYGEPMGESDPRLSDSDGDGISDDLEDRDHDGQCDVDDLAIGGGDYFRQFRETCAFVTDTDCNTHDDRLCPGGTDGECVEPGLTCAGDVCASDCSDTSQPGACLAPSGCAECETDDGGGCAPIADSCTCSADAKICDPKSSRDCPAGWACSDGCGCEEGSDCPGVFNLDGTVSNCTDAVACCSARQQVAELCPGLGESQCQGDSTCIWSPTTGCASAVPACCSDREAAQCFVESETATNFLFCAVAPESDCGDGIDNNDNGRADCEDESCFFKSCDSEVSGAYCCPGLGCGIWGGCV